METALNHMRTPSFNLNIINGLNDVQVVVWRKKNLNQLTKLDEFVLSIRLWRSVSECTQNYYTAANFNGCMLI